MLMPPRIRTRVTDKRRAVLFLNVNQKTILTLIVAALATVPLWLGLTRVHSEPSGSASPAVFTAIPEVKLESVPAEALIGEPFKFKVTFDNVGTDVGYGPFIDMVLPAGGKDLDNFLPSSTTHGPCDGISANMSSTLDVMMVSVNGGPLPVKTYKHLTIPCGTDGNIVTHPYSGSGISPAVVPLGGQLLTLELPFGSFEPAQPKIEVEITVDLHNFADVGPFNKLPIYARGGFRFGTTPLNDPLTDKPIVTDSGGPSYDNGTTPSISSTWTEQKDVTPTVFTVSKTYLGPEGEAVSGPNFVGYYPLRYQVTVNVANQQTVTNLVVNDCLENNMSFVGLVSPTTTGYTNLQTTPCLQMTYGSITGTTSAADVLVTYEFYITKSVGTSDTPVLDPEACGNTTSTNQATASGQWVPLDPRDVGLTPMTVSSSAKYVLADKHIAIQKSVKVKVQKKTTLVDKNGLPIPGDYLEYKMRFQISDLFTFGQIEIEDHLSDGQNLIQTSPALPASFRVIDQFGTVTGKFVDSGANADLAFEKTADLNCQGVPGGTRILFKVSQAMVNNTSLPRLNHGIMTGGYALTTSSPIPAEGEITFYVQIQDEFTYQPNERLLSIGNPDFDRDENPNLADLGSAAAEAKSIAGDYQGSLPLLGGEATKDRFLHNFTAANVIHFAGHFLANRQSPGNSKLLFAGGELRASELGTYKLPHAKLVVLSACETGFERYDKSEGAIGIARTFLALGAPLVVASQWKVDSEPTTDLMIAFHRNRKTNHITSAESLREAQLEVLRNGQTQSPYYWAAFSLFGGYANY